jgi:hypothetical protein
MMRTVVATFESPLKANEAVHVLLQGRFAAERLPRIWRGPSRTSSSSFLRLLDTIARKFRDFMDADMYLQPYARALAKGRFVVKVHAVHDPEIAAARKILEVAGGKEIEVLADAWPDS